MAELKTFNNVGRRSYSGCWLVDQIESERDQKSTGHRKKSPKALHTARKGEAAMDYAVDWREAL